MSALIFLGIIVAYFVLGYVVKVVLLVADAKLIDNACFCNGSGMVIPLWPLATFAFIIEFFAKYDFEALANRKTEPKKFSAEAVAKRIVEGKQRVILVEGNGEDDE